MLSALAAAALVVTGPAAAVSSSMGTISGFSMTLYDLNPSDGIDSKLSITSENSFSQVSVSSSSEYDDDSFAEYGQWAPTSAMATLAFGHAHAATDSSGAMAMGYASGPSYGGNGFFQAFAGGVVNTNFTLTPWTGIVMTLSFDGTASTTVGDNQEYAGVQASLEVGVNANDGRELHYATRSASASCAWDGFACNPETNSFSGTFSLGYANMSDVQVDGYMFAGVNASGYSTVPVPEPQTYMMLLAGLAGIGLVVRRRRAP